MSSWLKVAEDLFEVVDRRAKSVANDLSEEQTEATPPVSNGQEFEAKSTKTKHKAQRRLSNINPPKKSATPEKINDRVEVQTSGEKSLVDTGEVVVSSENSGVSNKVDKTGKELQPDISQDATTSENSVPVSQSIVATEKDGASDMGIPSSASALETSAPVNSDLTTEKTSGEDKVPFLSDSPVTEVGSADKDLIVDIGQDLKLENESVALMTENVGSELENIETHGNHDTQSKDASTKEELLLDSKQQQEPTASPASIKMQEQLDEAQGLLKSTISTGQSKEARLARVCAGLSSRLQEYKSENAQLEELLTAERELSNSYMSRIKQLQQDLSTSKVEVSRVESHMAEALAAKNSEIDSLANTLDTVRKQAAVSEGKLASLQVNMESMIRNRELAETRMMQALREELTSVERRAEEERAAHNATKMAAMEREVELEHRAVDATTALARMQRAVDERTSKVAELEQKLAFLEAESASLTRELQDLELQARRGQKKSSEEGNQALQMQAWQEEVDRARQGQRDAESKLSSLEAEVQKMRVEMAGMKRDAEHYSRQEHMELEKRYRELTDLLYHKQTQLETMASEKAAAEFQLEKEVKRLQEAKVEAERSRAPRRASSSYWEEDSDLKALEPLPLHHRHIAGASVQIQKAVKLLDSGAVTATRFLWRYPIARVTLLFYMVFVHLFLMYLLHRLQEQADNLSAQELAAKMGLSNPTFP